MAITKWDIRTWLYKCKSRATASVSDKGEEELLALVSKNKDLTALVSLTTCVVSNMQALKTEMAKLGVEEPQVTISISGRNSYGPLYKSAVASAAALVVRANKAMLPDEAALITATSKKNSDVSNEYCTLINKCETMKANKAFEYLTTLGFDTSTIVGCSDRPVDTSKLFVCGDNKPN